MPTAWWLRPVKKEARVGEQSDVTWNRLKRSAARGQGVHVRRPDVRAEGTQVAESGVVEDDGHHVGRARRGLGVAGETGSRLGGGEADLLGFVHGAEGRRWAAAGPHGSGNLAADAGPRSRTAAAPLPGGPGPVHRLCGHP